MDIQLFILLGRAKQTHITGFKVILMGLNLTPEFFMLMTRDLHVIKIDMEI